MEDRINERCKRDGKGVEGGGDVSDVICGDGKVAVKVCLAEKGSG